MAPVATGVRVENRAAPILPGMGHTRMDIQNRFSPEVIPLQSVTPAFEATSAPDHCVPTAQVEVKASYATMSDEDVLHQLRTGRLAQHQLEKSLENLERAVRLRRAFMSESFATKDAIEHLPFQNYDYKNVVGACCENVLGYVPIPVGVVGPVLINGKLFSIPMATTEGCLVASTHRGCKAITESGGAKSFVLRDGMTRAPVIRMPDVEGAATLCAWLEKEDNHKKLADAFNSTSRFARLQRIKCVVSGRSLYLRFTAQTGDAMGMNMISKGVERALDVLSLHFPSMQIVALSGNMCTDKKPSAVNWIEGRGKSVCAEAVIPGDLVRSVLKTTVKDLVDLNISKNLIGSAMAGSIGGFNAHASNIVTAIFLATGQDPAQNVESSNCITQMEAVNEGKDLHISVTMPSIEVGTVGGGTHLPGQAACLQMIGVKGANQNSPGSNAQELARVIAVAVMGGELSLMSALAAGHLVKSHMEHNRKKA